MFIIDLSRDLLTFGWKCILGFVSNVYIFILNVTERDSSRYFIYPLIKYCLFCVLIIVSVFVFFCTGKTVLNIEIRIQKAIGAVTFHTYAYN